MKKGESIWENRIAMYFQNRPGSSTDDFVQQLSDSGLMTFMEDCSGIIMKEVSISRSERREFEDIEDLIRNALRRFVDEFISKRQNAV
ncbi:hypothetical protein [Limisalsivibrio acetivorans]|uniref:hypothetical protein n=1 Tax=Limisalsivibrio acetivorans TaxID=1304888 RepID=UPI0003B78647|nr:hypothetical protein [Limisalsivibrio acetivorans]